MPIEQLADDGPSPSSLGLSPSPGSGYVAVLREPGCRFAAAAFAAAVLNILRNPNITSSHLFRADVLYDSAASDGCGGGGATLDDDLRDHWPADTALPAPDWPAWACERSLVRRLVPRNPQLDRAVEQTCHFLRRESGGEDGGGGAMAVVCIPHVQSREEVPWYHPAVQGLAFLFDWGAQSTTATGSTRTPSNGEVEDSAGAGVLTLHYRFFAGQAFPLPARLSRTAQHLLATVSKHARGAAAGYVKRVQHDQLVPQRRVQDRYAALKAAHAARLCAAWVEPTPPGKHVFEDLGIAAFLLELWRDMYRAPSDAGSRDHRLPPFPGFVDIGCGNGVLVEVLLRAGYPGWGFDARRRRTWAVLAPDTRRRLKELVLLPQPLLDLYCPPTGPSRSPSPASTAPPSATRVLARVRTAVQSVFSPSASSPYSGTQLSATDPAAAILPAGLPWHNGLFPAGTFIISNHADELTAWTPLLASLSASPFLAIPCCSHNLSGARFRAPSACNSHSADAAAPAFFGREKAGAVGRAKSVPISVPLPYPDDDDGHNQDDAEAQHDDGPAADQQVTGAVDGKVVSVPPAVETGDLKALSQAARARQPSAYASLCGWVAHLAADAGYVVEREALRIPSTRNLGIVGRRRTAADGGDGEIGTGEEMRAERGGDGQRERERNVRRIVEREGADAVAWVERARRLMAGSGGGKGSCKH